MKLGRSEMVEAVKTPRTPEMTKRAKWEKIKKDLLKQTKKWPEIIAIAVDVKNEGVLIVLKPVSTTYHSLVFDVCRKLQYQYGIPFEKFNVYNLGDFIREVPWKEHLLLPGYRLIFER